MSRLYNKRTDTIPKGAVYIGRPSKWGNPYTIFTDGDRVDVINKYRQWLAGKLAANELNIEELRGKDLVCWCSPLPCHGDVILEFLRSSGSCCQPESK